MTHQAVVEVDCQRIGRGKQRFQIVASSPVIAADHLDSSGAISQLRMGHGKYRVPRGGVELNGLVHITKTNVVYRYVPGRVHLQGGSAVIVAAHDARIMRPDVGAQGGPGGPVISGGED